MKSLFALVFLLSVSAGAAGAQDFETGIEAYDREDYAKAFAQLMPLAEQGNADAQLIVGLIYSDEKTSPRDFLAAVRWYSASANQGMGDAQMLLGMAYWQGEGVPRDNVLAYMWFNIANGAQKWPANTSKEVANASAKRAGLIRDLVAEDMTPGEIKEAQRRTREWLDAHPR